MTLPLVWLGLATSALLPADDHLSLPVSLHDSVIGAMAGYLSLWSIYQLFKLLTGKEGMGYGDFKLLAAIGAFLGWRLLLPTVLCAAAVGAVVGIAILTLQRKGRGGPHRLRAVPVGRRLDHADVGSGTSQRLPGTIWPARMKRRAAHWPDRRDLAVANPRSALCLRPLASPSSIPIKLPAMWWRPVRRC